MPALRCEGTMSWKEALICLVVVVIGAYVAGLIPGVVTATA